MAIGVLLGRILPLIPGLITVAELAFSGKPGSGDLKRQLVRELLDASLKALDETKVITLEPADKQAVVAVTEAVLTPIVSAVKTSASSHS